MTISQLPKNPFAVLKISTEASRQEVVERSKELIEDAEDRDFEIAYRKAVEQIISHPFERLIQAAWEMPDTDYEDHDETWRKFAKAFRSNPVALDTLRQLADAFIEENFEPDRLLNLLSPLLNISRPTGECAFTLESLVAGDLHHPFSSNELF